MDLAARTLETLDWPFVAEALASHARTGAGRRAARDIAFREDLSSITESFDAIDEIHVLVESRVGAPPVGGVEDIASALERAARGEVLDLGDVSAVGSTLEALAALQDFLVRQAARSPVLARLGSRISPDRKLCRAYASAIDEHGRLSEATWPVLGELRRRIAGLERNMRALLESLLDSPDYADLLQDRYVTVRGDRFVLPIKAQAKGLGLGIVHDSSRSERTVFIEPAAVVPMGNQRRMAEAALKEEEHRILAELSALLGSHAPSLRDAVTDAAGVDLACARADFAARLAAVRPIVGHDGVVALAGARHPVLALTSERVVANDLRLDADRPVLVLTGPNAGGKTVAMKTIGLCALLVRAGCFVPAAPGSRIDVFDTVLADIGDMQTVHEGLSSFSAHLTTLRAMLERAGKGSLLLLDEIAAGTDPAQGGALARAVLERLADVGARVVATTHYTQVKAMAGGDDRVEVAALEYQGGRPTYRVVPGTIGESHALSAASRVGLDAVLVERARSLMETGERALQEALASLDEEKTRAAEALRRAAALEADLAARERALAGREAEIQGRAREVERRAAAAVVDKLRSAEDEVRRAMAALREENSQRRADEARAAIGQARDCADDVVREKTLPSREPRVGDRVRVLRLGVIGEVIACRDDSLEVQAGVITVRARPGEVELVSAAVAAARPKAWRDEKRRAAAPSPDWMQSAIRSPSNTLDLRGVRVEEGLARLASFLDEAMLESRDVIFVLHGHGTGAMKSAIRKALADSPYVSATAPAPEDQGGDALTVSRLRG